VNSAEIDACLPIYPSALLSLLPRDLSAGHDVVCPNIASSKSLFKSPRVHSREVVLHGIISRKLGRPTVVGEPGWMMSASSPASSRLSVAKGRWILPPGSPLSDLKQNVCHYVRLKFDGRYLIRVGEGVRAVCRDWTNRFV